MPDGLEGLPAVVGDLVVVAVACQQVLEQQLVGGDILDRQHAQPGQRRRGRRGHRLRFAAGGEGAGNFEVEGRALSLLRFEIDPAVHGLDEAARNRQPQAGAAEAASDRGIGLAEILEQAGLGSVGYPDARIGDGEAQQAAAVGGGGVEPQRDRSVLGELDGIAQQVEHHLAQPAFVGQDMGWDGSIDLEFDAVAAASSLGLDDGGGRRDHGARADALVLDGEPAGLELREVEDVVHDRQEVVGRTLRRLDEQADLLVHRPAGGQPQHAENAVERRAQLVAHVGDEQGFCVVRLLGRRLRLQQRGHEAGVQPGDDDDQRAGAENDGEQQAGEPPVQTAQAALVIGDGVAAPDVGGRRQLQHLGHHRIQYPAQARGEFWRGLRRNLALDRGDGCGERIDLGPEARLRSDEVADLA